MCQVKMENIELTAVQQDECATCGRVGHTSDACPWFDRDKCTVTRRMVSRFGRCRASAERFAWSLINSSRAIRPLLSRESNGEWIVIHNEVVKCLI